MKTHYRPGDHVFLCDKCGMKRWASTGRFQWDNLFVCPECFDIRQPQDIIYGLPDDQSVAVARPDVAPAIGTTTVLTTAVINATSIDLTSVSGIASGDTIEIVLDNGNAHVTYSNGTPSGNTVTLGSYLPYKATAGNAVYLPAVNNEDYGTATSLTATGL